MGRDAEVHTRSGRCRLLAVLKAGELIDVKFGIVDSVVRVT